MQTHSQLTDLQELWKAVLGELPPTVQFVIWGELHAHERLCDTASPRPESKIYSLTARCR